MGTSCKIIIKSGDIYRGIRVHFDGYLEWAGVILFRNYNTDDKVFQLISLGDLSVLDANIGTNFDASDEHRRDEKRNEHQCVAYHRDYGRPLHISEGHTLEEVFELEDYAYFWDGEDWVYCPYGKPLAMLKDLIPIQQALESKSEISFEYAQGLVDEWIAYADKCLKEHNWRFLGLPTWLGAIKKLSSSQIEEVIKLATHTWSAE